MILTGEALAITIALIMLLTTTNGVHRQVIHDLREDKFAGVHVPTSRSLDYGLHSIDTRLCSSSR